MNRDITSLPAVVADERVPYGQDASQFFDLWVRTISPYAAQR